MPTLNLGWRISLFGTKHFPLIDNLILRTQYSGVGPLVW